MNRIDLWRLQVLAQSRGFRRDTVIVASRFGGWFLPRPPLLGSGRRVRA